MTLEGGFEKLSLPDPGPRGALVGLLPVSSLGAGAPQGLPLYYYIVPQRGCLFLSTSPPKSTQPLKHLLQLSVKHQSTFLRPSKYTFDDFLSFNQQIFLKLLGSVLVSEVKRGKGKGLCNFMREKHRQRISTVWCVSH